MPPSVLLKKLQHKRHSKSKEYPEYKLSHEQEVWQSKIQTSFATRDGSIYSD